MTPARLQTWRTLLGAKQRAIGRLESDLAAQRAALAEAQRQAALCVGLLGERDQALARHAARLERLLAGTAGLSPLDYLEHQAWHGQLVEQRREAQAALRTMENIVLDKQREIRQTQQQIATTGARRDDLAAALAAGMRAVDLAHQDAQDDEAGETGVARMLAQRAGAAA